MFKNWRKNSYTHSAANLEAIFISHDPFATSIDTDTIRPFIKDTGLPGFLKGGWISVALYSVRILYRPFCSARDCLPPNENLHDLRRALGHLFVTGDVKKGARPAVLALVTGPPNMLKIGTPR